MGSFFRKLLSSRKAVMTIASVASYGLARAGLDIPAEELAVPLGLVGAYVLGQSYVDGKAYQASAERTAAELEAIRAMAGTASTAIGKAARAAWDAEQAK
jgi:hypothetical protein